MSEFKVAHISVDEIKPSKDNPRKHRSGQIEKIAKSIKTYGFTQPIVVDQAGDIVIGEGRYMAAKSLGMKEVPVLRMKLTPAKRKALMIADNKLGDESTWDDNILKLLLKDSDVSDLETGFDQDEIAAIVGESADFDDVDIEYSKGTEVKFEILCQQDLKDSIMAALVELRTRHEFHFKVV